MLKVCLRILGLSKCEHCFSYMCEWCHRAPGEPTDWIRADFKLPEEGEEVLVCGDNFRCLASTTSEFQCWWWVDEYEDNIDGVTHWMRIPAIRFDV